MIELKDHQCLLVISNPKMTKPKIKVKCSECDHVEDMEIEELYRDLDPELQHAGEKNCSVCGKLLTVYITTYMEEY